MHKEVKSILLIGLGRFGQHIAETLHAMHHDIIAIDKDEEKVNAILPLVTNAMVADSTQEEFLKSLGIPDFDLAIVAIGDDFQSSLETTSQLKEFGARFVIARASRGIHEKFLKRNGADVTIYPERDTALWTATLYGSSHVLDYFKINEEYAVFEIPVPEKWLGKSIKELEIRKKYHLNILGIKKNDEIAMDIRPDLLLEADETLLVVGKQESIDSVF